MGSPFPFSDEEMMAQIAAARTPQEKERVRQLLGEYGDWLEVNDAQQEWRPTVLLTDEQFDELVDVLDGRARLDDGIEVRLRVLARFTFPDLRADELEPKVDALRVVYVEATPAERALMMRRADIEGPTVGED